jgi:hypothetical protein
MTVTRDPDDTIATWLDDGPLTLPAETRRAIAVGLRTQPRAGRMAILGGSSMNRINRVAAAAAIIFAVGGLGAFGLSNRASGPAVLPSSALVSTSPSPATPVPTTQPASPLSSPSGDPLDTRAWLTYTSALYHFDIGHPATWTVRSASRPWSFDLDSDTNAPITSGADHFTSPDERVRVSAWDVALESAVNVDSREQLLTWISDYCTRTGSGGCSGIAARAIPFCNEWRDCHVAYLVPFDDWVGAFAWGGSIVGSVRIVAIWRSENEAEVAPYRGARALLEAFLSTMNIVPATAEQLGSSPPPPS